MNTTIHNSDAAFVEDPHTINWCDIENTEIDYNNYLNEIESLFREDFENNIFEEEDV